MTSFSSSSTARPTGRLLCSACRLGIVGSCPLASVTRRVLVPPRPPQRTSTHSRPPPTPGSCPSLCWSPRPLPGPWSCLGALRWTDGWERAQTCTSPPAGGREALDFTLPPSGALEPRGSVVPAGGARRTPPGWQTLSPEVCPDSASSQNRGVCHPLPASCPSAACPPTTPA